MNKLLILLRMIKKDVPFLILLPTLLVLAIEASASGRSLDLYAGQAKTLGLGTITRVAVGNPEIVNYKVLENGSLLLIGVQPGISTVSIWKDGDRHDTLEITVLPLPMDRQMKVASELVKHFKGLSVEKVGHNLVFKGSVDSAFLETIDQIVQQLPGALNLVRGDGFELSELVRLDVKIVEIKRQDLKKLGVRWDSEIGGPAYGLHSPFTTNPVFGVVSTSQNGLPTEIREILTNANYPVNNYDTLQYFGVTTGISSRIDALAEVGQARILSAPKLVARSGETAEFLSGGEFPIPVINQDGFVNVDFRDYGILLNILPVVSGENIKVALEVEVSNIDPAVQVNGIPGLLNRRATTTINMKNRDSLVVSGLVANTTSKQTSKVPFLGDIPVLGKLFSSTDNRVEESEVMVMVTPHIVTPENQDNQLLVKKVKAYVEEVQLETKLDTLLLE